MVTKENDDESGDECGGGSRLLLTSEETPFSPNNLCPPMPKMPHAHSYSSFYDFPQDLTKFSSDRNRLDGVQPVCMTSAWRVLSFFAVVFLLPTLLISIPLYARYHIYHTRTIAFTDGDMVSLHSMVSSFWCQGQRVISDGPYEAYMTEDKPKIKKKIRKTYLSSEIILNHDDAEEWGMNLIKGSHLTFSTCARWPGGTLVVVQGEENMRRCFYKEERLEHELNDNIKPTPKPYYKQNITDSIFKSLPDIPKSVNKIDENINTAITNETMKTKRIETNLLNKSIEEKNNDDNKKGEDFDDDDDNKGGEDFDDDDVEMEDIIFLRNILKIYQKKSKNRSLKNIDIKTLYKALNLPINTTIAQSNESKETMKPKHVIVKRYAKENVLQRISNSKVIFNISDSLIVTAGNSSFSSSEEFLQGCSDTIVSIDLSPSKNCPLRASIHEKSDIRWRFRANKTDFYYFIFTSDNSIETNTISFRLMLERKLYNVHHYKEKCYNQTVCNFALPFMKSRGVIVDFNQNTNISTLEQLQNYNLTSVCRPRVAVYTIFILFVPLSIIMFAFR